MFKLEVFDPPLCCSTGVCGPEIDPALSRFAGDLEWLRRNNVAVTRYNLAQEPQAFVGSPLVKQELDARGNSCLPLILANGRILTSGFYPQRRDLESALSGFGVEFQPSAAAKEESQQKGECCDEPSSGDCDDSEPGCCG